MNPSYVRLQVTQENALPRFSAWLNLPELEPPTIVSSTKAVNHAVEENSWRGAAFFIYENDGWTVFEDMTGHLSTKSTQDWLRLAGQDPLVFAGYNDAISAAKLMVVTDGQIVREFRDDEQDPAHNVNEERLGFGNIDPIQSWVEAASYVAGDDLAVSPDYGTLWIFRNADQRDQVE